MGLPVAAFERAFNSEFHSHNAVPFEDANGVRIVDWQGNNMMRPEDVPPSFFIEKGLEAAEPNLEGSPSGGGKDLLKFRIGRDWDVQRVGSDKNITPAFRDYANVVIGIYAAAAGYTKNEILLYSEAGAVVGGSKWPNQPMDKTYTRLPQRNVYDISLGWDLYKSGRVR